MVLANRFKGLRAEKGYTQKDVADLLGISPTAVASWEQERNNPNLDTLVRIAKLFDVSNAAGEEKHPRGCPLSVQNQSGSRSDSCQQSPTA